LSFEGIKFGICPNLYPLELIYEMTEFAEKIGLDSVMMGDHLVAIGIKRREALEAWTTLAAIASRTCRIKLGTCVTDPHRRHPAVLAQTVATLDIVSGGRVIFAIGPGEAMNLDPYGIPWNKPVTRMRETIEILKKLWTEQSVNYTGEFFKLHEAILEPKPIQKPHPPIWVAGISPRTMRITAELADGWFPLLLTPDQYRAGLSNIRHWADQVGRKSENVEPALFLYTVVAEDREKARQLIEVPAKMLLTLFPKSLVQLGYSAPIEELNAFNFIVKPETVKMVLEKSTTIPSEAIQQFFVFGSPDDCIEGLEKYIKAGVRYFALALLTPPPLTMATFKLYAEKVLPYFREDIGSK
jgi:alkanesulfonate monooxygenase SsuD/methylene tetrahydromethanopterin reductase-like flavin-dependent oxidoreductase (luciferase family)